MASVGLNGLLLESPHSGTATYTHNLAALLPLAAPDLAFTLYVRNGSLQDSIPQHVQLTTPLDGLRGPGGARASKLVWEEVALPGASALRDDSLLHYLYFAAPVLTRAPVVVTIHDLIPLVMPGYHRSRQSLLYARFMAWTVKRAAAIVTVSDYSRREIIRCLDIPEHRVHVTYEAADDRFRPDGAQGEAERIRRQYGLPLRFILYLGGAERRKGLETLVRAWKEVATAMHRVEMCLVIVAQFPPADPLYPDIPGLVRELDLHDVRLISSVDEDDKPALYRAAAAFAFPSVYEGFGLTPLESMASGTPVVASSATSIPEVVGDAAMLVPPRDVDAWASALLEIAESQRARDELSRKGIERSRRFTWKRTAEQTADLYRAVLAR